MRPTDRKRWLTLILRFDAAITLSAFLAMVLPTEWMAAAHSWLGLGEFPRTPLVEYLTRSIAALYGFHGGLLLLLSFDPLKHLTIVKYIAFMNVAFGLIVLAIDIEAGMPTLWTLFEGPGVVLMGIALFVFSRDSSVA